MAGSDETEQLPAGETLVSFHYDALDTLIGRSASGGREQRFYRNDELVNEIHGTNSSTFVRANDLVLAEQQAGDVPKTLLLAGDDKNSVLSEISQDAVKAVAYSAYGHHAEDGAVNSHLGYNGERRETQTGWYLLRKGYRVFNPLLMRFHSPDNLSPFGKGGLNAYMYCVGDPINNVDPTGHIGFFHGLFNANISSFFSRKIPGVLRVKPQGKSAARFTLVQPEDLDNIKTVYAQYFRDRQVAVDRLESLELQGKDWSVTVPAAKEVEKLTIKVDSYIEAFEVATRKYEKRKVAITEHSRRKLKELAEEIRHAESNAQTGNGRRTIDEFLGQQ
ncbi:RHS repeat-associated core domain-containing protein [Pseudomonas sp. R3-41]